jgi:predicted O-methyltransferase YrrM
MKSSVDAILDRPQAEYLDSLLPPDDPLLEEMIGYASEHRHPIADPEVAQLMRVLLAAKKPKRILEVGTNIGYSVVVMGRACPDAVIETIEIDRETLDVANEFVARGDVRATVVFHLGAALDVIPRLDGPFDFVFIDCVKTEYGAYLDLLLPKIASGGVIVCDNLLWKGRIAKEGTASSDRSTVALHRFNEEFVRRPDLVSTIVAVGDGIGVAVRN